MRAPFIATILVCLVVLVLLAFTGNADAFDPANVQDQVAIMPAELSGATMLGQSFVFHYPRLHAIHLRAIVSDDFQAAPDSLLTLHLRHHADDVGDRATASVAIKDIRHNEFIRFEFSPLDDSQDHAFYFFLDASRTTIARGYLSVWASDRDAYPDGQLFLDARPADGDLAFRAYYALDFPIVLQSLARELAHRASVLVLVLIVFFLPGLIVSRAHRSLEAFVIASCAGLAMLSIAPLIFAWLNLRVHWLALLAFAAFLIFVANGHTRIRRFSGLFVRASDRVNARPQEMPHKIDAHLEGRSGERRLREGALVLAFASFSLALGLLQIQGIAVPLWVDSPTHAAYIHALALLERLPIASYHLGYHSIVALLAQMSGIAIPELMLVVGQVLITLTGLSVFVLCKKNSGNDLGALASAICIWFLAPTPAYLISWGRYPLLWGGALLPIALVCAIDLIEQPRVTARAIFFAALTAVALAFAQIRLVAFYAIFVAVLIGVERLRGFVSSEQPAKASSPRAFVRIAIIAATGIVFIALWLALLFGGGIGIEKILEKNAGTVPIDLAVAFQVVFSHHGAIVAMVAGIAALAAIFSRRRGALIVLAWYGALISIALIAGEYVSLSFVVLMGFLPASLLIGDLIARVDEWSRAFTRLIAQSNNPLKRRVQSAIILFTLALASILGARDLVSIINPTTMMFSRADARAIEWIRANTPADARFLINSFQWYGMYYVPSDGGAWMPYLANRASEFIALSPEFPQADADSVARWIAEHRITHIYLGARAGILDRKIFAERFELIYSQNGSAVYQVK